LPEKFSRILFFNQKRFSGTQLLPVKNLTKILALTENPENIFFHACEKIRKKIQKKSYSNSR